MPTGTADRTRTARLRSYRDHNLAPRRSPLRPWAAAAVPPVLPRLVLPPPVLPVRWAGWCTAPGVAPRPVTRAVAVRSQRHRLSRGYRFHALLTAFHALTAPGPGQIGQILSVAREKPAAPPGGGRIRGRIRPLLSHVPLAQRRAAWCKGARGARAPSGGGSRHTGPLSAQGRPGGMWRRSPLNRARPAIPHEPQRQEAFPPRRNARKSPAAADRGNGYPGRVAGAPIYRRPYIAA
jgi:hypothetical protein